MSLGTESATRKLAAVMFTDIKGFSKKMARNETAAFELLRTHDALMRVIASKYEGKVVKSIGDSFMVDYASAVNAVKAAIDAQKRFWTFNKGKDELDMIEVRIGIHLGDVMVSGDDMYGDGINIASRIEAITEPNHICISADIYNQVKNKMDIKVFRLGNIPLRNIPEPVEIFEILIDAIPELAEPSETARQAQKRVVDTTESESAEAHSVETAKKLANKPVPQVEDTASQVESLYKKAEQLYNEGKIEEAERTIDQIAKIDPGYHAAVERKKVEDEKEKKVNEHYERAGAYIREGNFDLAEQEVREIFQLFPLHTGAQQLQLQIEEERYRKTEEERNARLDKGRKERAEKDKQVEELTRATEDHIEKDELVEAREALQKIYSLEPNFVAGERLEEKLRRAEAAKVERERQQSFLEQGKLRPEMVLPVAERPVERPQPKPRVVEEEKPRIHINWKAVGQVAAVLAAVALLYYLYPKVKRALFPVNASIAVTPFNSPAGEVQDDTLGYVVPLLLSQDFDRIEHAHVAAALGKFIQEADYPTIAGARQVRYVLHGTVSKTESGLSVTIRLYDHDQQSIVIAKKFEGTVLSLNLIRSKIVKTILDGLDMDDSPPDIPAPTKDADAFAHYLRALYLADRNSVSALDLAESNFRQAVQIDSTFAAAYGKLAHVRLLQYVLGTPDGPTALQDAIDFSQKAVRLGPAEYSGYRSLAESYFYRRQFDKVRSNVQKSLSLQPDDAVSYGIIAQLELVEGNYDQAMLDASFATKRAPDDASLQVILGLTDQFKRNYPEALAAFRQAITLGLPDSLLTARYVLNAMTAKDLYDDVASYYQNVLKKYPRDYQSYYGISRAYQMKPSIPEFKTWSDRGISFIQNYVDKVPTDAFAHAYLGLLLARSGKFPEGENEMEQASAYAPRSTTMLFRRADFYAIQKKDSLAAATLQEALKRDFDFSEILNPD
ncbi:MAG TPA: adenylate/guanylate cyclase domain-containing protein, partial [Bacteroidota bacterium]|nr:adenylate/guanylate cyclase domain-containing protein [Bacteroidota bacterium]